jgi:hypothetical protein
MRQALKIHPDSPNPGVSRIEVEVTRPTPAALALDYRVAGTMSGVILPPVTTPARSDGLWRHTCFEAFIAAGAETGYLEFNFAPSTQWAAYRFGGYRAGMSAVDIGAPRIEMKTTAEHCELRVALDLAGLLPSGVAWRLGLSAVIEEAGGATSYWALAHPPGRPDFHHATSFAIDLPSTELS